MKARKFIIGAALGAVAVAGFATPAFATGSQAYTNCHAEECGKIAQREHGQQDTQSAQNDQSGHTGSNNGNHNGNGNGNNNGNGNGNMTGNHNKYQNVNGNDNKLYMDSFNNRHFDSYNHVCADCGKVAPSVKVAPGSTITPNTTAAKVTPKTSTQVAVKPAGAAHTGGGFLATR